MVSRLLVPRSTSTTEGQATVEATLAVGVVSRLLVPRSTSTTEERATTEATLAV
ncbi:hypothetical protein HMPREF0063_11300 [Aeromicrobium marinum DSM 15272]|uniref:Uncharacterized protein n=1 Tax=Aeromicrobium marinum DSM 15272 TaxID=585531 RepID=E2SB91_9ACTN|nr:hypothetical protein [Aeromicrobium marinum]EFQ83637.1 hypothetical protein HMPREF0063_11300 [Aeromicrobium marinum DSM 15272]